MARRLSPDGVPIEIPSIQRKKKTSLFDGLERDPSKESGRPYSGDDPTEAATKKGATSIFPDDPPTRPAHIAGRTAPTLTSPEPGDRKTRIAGGFRRSRFRSDSGEPAATDTPLDPNVSEDPVVGWLVVVDGPGKGSSVRLGMGQNSIGRGKHARVRVNFGDDQISRSNHASITYDPRSNSFHVHPGTGPNLTYLDGDLVLAPTLLPNRSRLLVGETTLRFVALCADGFSWHDRD